MTPEQEAVRGEEADRLINNPLLKEAFQEIESRVVAQMAQIEITKERAEYLRTILVANRKVEQYLRNVMAGGKMAALDIEHKGLMDRVRDRAKVLF